MKQVKNLIFRGPTCIICYARNGHRLYEGATSNIPEHLLNYYTGYVIYNKVTKNTYLEVTEDKGWWKPDYEN